MEIKAKKIRVLLYAGFKDNTIFYSAVSPPLGLFRLKHFLEKRDIHCDVHDLSLHDNDFKDTMELIKKIKFTNSYSFIFSQRPGTVAADLNLVDKKKI